MPTALPSHNIELTGLTVCRARLIFPQHPVLQSVEAPCDGKRVTAETAPILLARHPVTSKRNPRVTSCLGLILPRRPRLWPGGNARVQSLGRLLRVARFGDLTEQSFVPASSSGLVAHLAKKRHSPSEHGGCICSRIGPPPPRASNSFQCGSMLISDRAS